MSIMICLGLLLNGCASDAGKDMGTISDGSIPVVLENAVEAQTEVTEINATAADESEVEGSEISAFDSAEEIVCENPFFFPKNITSITAEMNYYSGSLKERTTVELNLHWVKQYENGCLAKLSIIPFDRMPDYMDDTCLNTYFYVTDSEIYRISPSIVQGDEIITFNNDDTLVVSILDTDEKLMEYGELKNQTITKIIYGKREQVLLVMRADTV